MQVNKRLLLICFWGQHYFCQEIQWVILFVERREKRNGIMEVMANLKKYVDNFENKYLIDTIAATHKLMVSRRW